MPALTLLTTADTATSNDIRQLFTSGTTNLLGAGDKPLSDTPTNFVAMSALSWKVEHRQQGRTDDTLALAIRVMDGTTVLAAGDSGGAFQVVSAAVTSATDVTTGPTAFAYVNSSATKAQWDAAKLELQQTYSTSMSNDNARIEVDFVELTGTYFSAFPVDDTFTDTNGTLLSNHVADTGEPWAAMPGGLLQASGSSGTTASITNGVASHQQSSNIIKGYRVEAIASSESLDLLADFLVGNTSSSDSKWLLGVLDHTFLGQTVGRYVAGLEGGATPSWKIWKVAASAVTTLATLSEAVANGTYRVKFEVRDAAKKLFVWNGSSWIEKCSTTDNTLTTRRQPAIGPPQRGVDGNGLDNFTTLIRVPLIETFTDTGGTLLSAHRSESHHSYVAQDRALNNGNPIATTAAIVSNSLHSSSSTERSVGYLLDVPFETNEYDVFADFVIGEVTDGDAWGIGARMGGGSFYGLGYQGASGTGQWFIRTQTGSTGNAVGSSAVLLAPGTYHVKAEIRNATKKLFVWDDAIGWGVAKVQTSLNTITQIGSVGIMAPKDISGNAVDNLTTVDPGYVVSASAAMAMIL